MERPRQPVRGASKRRKRRTVREAALRLLRRRPRARRELEQELTRLDYPSAEIEATLNALEQSGLVNDAELARHFIAARAARLGHGRERLLAELERRGVSRKCGRRAWDEAVENGEVDPREQLRAAVERRVRGASRLDARGYARVYNALLRAGYDAEDVRRELDPYHAGASCDTFRENEIHDDFP